MNTPRRPLEASGTSGMKVIANGGLNFSVLDGWWDEGFDPEIGWKIGNGEEYTDPDYQDELESRQLYNTLETNIIPLFYSRGEDGLPREWIQKVKQSMKKLGPYFNTHRMVQQYFENYYKTSFEKRLILSERKWSSAKELASWKENLKRNWSNIKLVNLETHDKSKTIYVGENLPVAAELNLGELSPQDVEVQAYYGPLDQQDNPEYNETIVLKSESKKLKDGNYKFTGSITTRRSGQQGFTIRVLPKHPLLINQFELGLIYWGG